MGAYLIFFGDVLIFRELSNKLSSIGREMPSLSLKLPPPKLIRPNLQNCTRSGSVLDFKINLELLLFLLLFSQLFLFDGTSIAGRKIDQNGRANKKRGKEKKRS